MWNCNYSQQGRTRTTVCHPPSPEAACQAPSLPTSQINNSGSQGGSTNSTFLQKHDTIHKVCCLCVRTHVTLHFPCNSVSHCSNSDIIPDDVPCRQALEQARMLVLDNKQYILEHYPPEVTSMTVYGQLCVGLPYVVHAEVWGEWCSYCVDTACTKEDAILQAHPSASILHIHQLVQVAYTHPDACEYIWRRSDKPVKARHGHVPGEPVQWVEVGRGKLYSPTKEDAGHALCVECTPMRRYDGVSCQMHIAYWSLTYTTIRPAHPLLEVNLGHKTQLVVTVVTQ